MRSANRLPIYLLTFPDVQLLDVSGPLQVFATANEVAPLHGQSARYVLHVVSAEPRQVMSTAGLGLATSRLPGAGERCDTLIVAGGRGVRAASGDARLTSWIRRRAATSRRVASVCTGAFLLAAAGLLNERRVATHWAHCDELAARYPALHIERDPIFINDGPIWTSAGVTAGIDLSLALVEQDLGRAVALDVARHLVVSLKRPGGQAQFSMTLSLQREEDRFGDLHAWIAEHLSADLSVTRLAARLKMSERSFMRRYRTATGKTPAQAVAQLRIEAASRLLVETTLSVKRIAAKCGFGSEETMRRTFLRTYSVPPQAYRERFA